MSKVDILAKKIWNYMHMGHELEKANAIIAFGSHDLRTAEHACDLYFQGWAPIIVFSGFRSNKNSLEKSEAETYKEIALSRGIPSQNILTECNSTNSGENVLFTKKLLEDKSILCTKLIVVHKPYMERRSYATLEKQWPGPKYIMSSLGVDFEKYVGANMDYKGKILNTMIGDLVRIKEYPKLGFQVEQEIPEDVWQAAQELIKMGYNKHLPKI